MSYQHLEYWVSMYVCLLDYKLNNYDASIADCSQILSTEPNHIKGLLIKILVFMNILYIYIALFRRASCFIAKQKYEEAKYDLDVLLTVDEDNNEAKVNILI